MTLALALGFGIVVWWASTGAILVAARQPAERHMGLVWGAKAFAILAVFAFVMASGTPRRSGRFSASPPRS